MTENGHRQPSLPVRNAVAHNFAQSLFMALLMLFPMASIGTQTLPS
eukprot:SAG31_NODE_18661_length_627_cov_1.223485_3_plen_45_part_01